MSNLALFIVGTLISLLVTASMALLVWGAILDGRAQQEFEEAERQVQRTDERLHAVDAA
jgi:hypothetical protein